MAEITLARVDDRLVHGQVMQVWTKGHGTNAAYVIDDATAADEFMKEIYEPPSPRAASPSRSSLPIPSLTSGTRTSSATTMLL